MMITQYSKLTDSEENVLLSKDSLAIIGDNMLCAVSKSDDSRCSLTVFGECDTSSVLLTKGEVMQLIQSLTNYVNST